MPQRTFIHKQAKQAPGFKSMMDRLTLVLCCNAAGHTIKPGLIYRSMNPRALKNKNKSNLPVFWQSNRKAWMTAVLFSEWFNRCFVPEVKRYLEREGLPFKALLLIDNAPGHPESLVNENKHVKVIFLPPNTTSLLQPLDQGVIRCLKASYARQVFEMICVAAEDVPDSEQCGIMDCWKSFNIADAIVFIKAAMDDLRPETVRACWKKLLPQTAAVPDDGSVPDVNPDVHTIIEAARVIGGEGFAALNEQEVVNFLDEPAEEELTTSELEELVKSSSKDEASEGNEEQQSWTYDKFSAVFQTAKMLKEQILQFDPIMERSIKITREITQAMEPLNNIFNEMKKRKRQPPITDYFKVSSKEVRDDPQPSTSHD